MQSRYAPYAKDGVSTPLMHIPDYKMILRWSVDYASLSDHKKYKFEDDIEDWIRKQRSELVSWAELNVVTGIPEKRLKKRFGDGANDVRVKAKKIDLMKPKIKELIDLKWTQREIAAELQIGLSTLQKRINEMRAEGILEPLPENKTWKR